MIEISEKKNCTGCHACASVCPQDCIIMKIDPEGFLYPSVDQTECIECGRCEAVCPIFNWTEVKNEPIAYACINKNEAVRLESSSGGIFTLLAEEMIDQGGVVFGAGFDTDFSASHHYVETKEELKRFRGSKYVQSRIGETFRQAKDFLDKGCGVLFTGTPCQIAGLQSYLGNSYDHLICVDIICHGVPSPKVWQKYVAYRGERAGGKAQSVSFRNKDKGWKRFSMSFVFSNQKRYSQTFEKDPFMQAFLKNICLRPSCYSCEFKSLHRQSDITLGDFWGAQNILPDLDDDKGTSLIFINSDRGQEIFDAIQGDIRYQDADINMAIQYNPAAVRAVKSHKEREVFFEKLDELPFDKLVKRYCRPAFDKRVRKRIIKMGAQVKRMIKR